MPFDERSALLWDVVLGDASWSDALQEIAATTGATVVLLFRQGPRAWDCSSHGLDGRDASGLMDPDRNPITRGMYFAAIGTTIDRRQLICDDAFRRNESLAMLREQGAFHGLMCKLEGRDGSPSMQASFGISFPERHGDACGDRARDFAAWIRPMQRALRTQSVLGRSAAHQRAYSDALSTIGVGAIAVDADFTIRQANAEADRILAAADGIECRLGRLSIAAPDCQQRLRRRILGASMDHDECGPIDVPRRAGLPGYLLDVIPARDIRAAAIVLITDPVTANSLPDAECIMQRFGLTAGEARVARLVPLALSKAQIAQQLGLSENTVKSHIAAARGKMGVRNMVELALAIRRA
jgi:DNA-binding CsgD family transcriptional regulator